LLLYAWLTDPARLLETCRARYGPVFRLRIAGWGQVAVVADVGLARMVANDVPGFLETGSANELMRPLVGNRSIFIVDGVEHRRLRRSLAPLFSTQARAHLEEMLTNTVRDELADRASLDERAASAMLRRVSCRATWTLIAGRDDPASMALAEPLMRALGPRAALAAFAGQPLQDMIGGPVRRAVEDVERAIDAEIAAQEGGDKAPGGIIGAILADTSQLLAERRETARDNARSLLVAGGDTTASAGAWLTALALGPRNPSYDRLRAAVTTGDRTYLDATIREALRLGPVVEIISRRAVNDFERGGYRFRAGDLVSPCPYLIHRDPAVYPRPLSFDPDRFVGITPPPDQYMPFGAGARHCLGFAVATVILSSWAIALTRSGLIATGSGPLSARRRNVTLAPHPMGRIERTKAAA
jgi:cytochrome P450